MSGDEPKLIDRLKEMQRYHAEELRQIGVALAALGQGASAGPEPRPVDTKGPVRWTAEVMQLFDETDRPLTLKQVCEKLAERGFPQALEKRYESTIYSVLARGVKKSGTLQRAGKGKYRKKQEVLYSRQHRT